MAGLLSTEEIMTQLRSSNSNWDGDEHGLRRVVKFSSFSEAIRFLGVIAPICDELNHHPDVVVSWCTLTFQLLTHDVGGVTRADIELSAIIEDCFARFASNH